MTNQPRGFAFVEFSDNDVATEAIDRLDGTELSGRSLRVSEARDRVGGGPPPRVGGGERWSNDLPPRKTARPKGSRRGVRGHKRGL